MAIPSHITPKSGSAAAGMVMLRTMTAADGRQRCCGLFGANYFFYSGAHPPYDVPSIVSSCFYCISSCHLLFKEHFKQTLNVINFRRQHPQVKTNRPSRHLAELTTPFLIICGCHHTIRRGLYSGTVHLHPLQQRHRQCAIVLERERER
jgi:hypothetical protein